MKVLIQVDFKLTDGDKDDDNNHVNKVIQLRSKRFEVRNSDDVSATMTKMADDIQKQFGKSILGDPGIVIDIIGKNTTNYDKYNSARAGSYIELPKWVSPGKACMNIKNEDKQCFNYCVQCSVFYNLGERQP